MSVYSTFGLCKRSPGFESYGKVGVSGESMTKLSMGIRRPAYYAVNGTGRDCYIAVDNGGFSRPFEPAFTPETGVFGSRKQNRDFSLASIDAKHTNYTSNGTGRDGYIW
jgi:hypothetical protein